MDKIEELKNVFESNQKEHDLKQIVKELFWMARRYAHGHNADAMIVRSIYRQLKREFPEIKIEPDDTIKPPKLSQLRTSYVGRSDYLDDTNEPV